MYDIHVARSHYLSSFSKYRCPKNPVHPVKNTHLPRKKSEIGESQAIAGDGVSQAVDAFAHIFFALINQLCTSKNLIDKFRSTGVDQQSADGFKWSLLQCNSKCVLNRGMRSSFDLINGNRFPYFDWHSLGCPSKCTPLPLCCRVHCIR